MADVEDGTVREVERRLTITRLGEGVDARRLLLPTALARVRNALGDYRRVLEEAGAERTLAIATSAVRDAENGEAFLGEIEWSYGFDDAAAHGRRGGAPHLPRRLGRRARSAGTLVIDVGGGSTELVLADWHRSLDLGCVRLTERFLHSDPPTAARARGLPRRTFARCSRASREPTRAIGVAGTVTTLRRARSASTRRTRRSSTDTG